MKYENPALLSLAQFAPHCMGCGKANEGDVVPAHRNEGKGMGLKNPDFMWAALCTLKCHYELDQGNKWSREEKRAFWNAAYWRTQMWLWTSGLLTIAVSVASALPPPRPKPRKRIRSGRAIQLRGFEKPDTPRKIPSRPFSRTSRTTDNG
ncbi:hypothetical protein [Caulobacter segnis]